MIKNPYPIKTPINSAIERSLPVGIPFGYSEADKRMATPKVYQVENTIVVTATTGATIYYTTDGSTPTTGSSVYTEPVVLGADATFKCIAVLAGRQTSNVATKAFVKKLTCATPSITASGNQIVITTATTGATIHYTIDGTTPTADSPVYEEAVDYIHNVMCKAIAIKDGMYNSEVDSEECVFNGDATIDILHEGETILFGTLTRLTINEVEYATEHMALVRFSVGETPTTLDLPDTLWAGGETPDIEALHMYQISYCNGVGVLTDLGAVS